MIPSPTFHRSRDGIVIRLTNQCKVRAVFIDGTPANYDCVIGSDALAVRASLDSGPHSTEPLCVYLQWQSGDSVFVTQAYLGRVTDLVADVVETSGPFPGGE